MSGIRVRAVAHRALMGVLLLAGLALGWSSAVQPPRAAAQEFDESDGVVPDSVFQEAQRFPAYYQTQYFRDQSRGGWTQSLDYSRNWKRLAMNVSGSSGTSEDALRLGSRSTNGDMFGMLNWRAASKLVVSANGRFSMSSIADGARASTSEQRRSNLSLQSQYRTPLFGKATFTVIGSSELQRNYDLRTSERSIVATAGDPDSLALQRDSSYVTGRLDAVRGQLRWPLMRGVEFEGKVYGSRGRPRTSVRTFRSTQPYDGSAGYDSIDVRRIQLPTDNALLDGMLTIQPRPVTKIVLKSKRTGIDQVYFDLAQLQVEQFSNDGRLYSLAAQSAPFPGVSIMSNVAMNRTLREYVARPNLNALVISREASAGIAYSSPVTECFVNAIVNRTRAEQQTTGNGITISRVLTTNFRQRVLGRLWLTGLGTATLYSYRYTFAPDSANSERIYSVDDRDVASAFGSVGARFAFTPRCSTALSFSISRVRNVSVDSLRSAGNIATTVYQLNGALRLPLHRNLSIGQDYIVTATYREFAFNEGSDDLSRNFRIETTVADTLFPFAYLRVDHRYYFFDQGDFTPLEVGGPGFYGVAQEQAQQILEGTIGIRPVPGVTLVVKQSLADTQNRNLIDRSTQGTEQWNLSLGLELNRSFRNGAGLVGAIRREGKYQNRSEFTSSVSKENNWLAGITFQKEFLRRTIVSAFLALLAAGGVSCDLFETRNPADPGGIRFPCASLLAADSVFIDISRAYGSGNGLGCYLSTLGDTTFAFHADPTDSANSPAQFISWTKVVEERVTQNITNDGDADYFFLQLKLPYIPVVVQSDLETRRYAYEIRFKGNAISDTLFQGLAEITVRKGAGGQWQVGDWVDRRDPGGTTSLTWGYLRGSYRIGI